MTIVSFGRDGHQSRESFLSISGAIFKHSEQNSNLLPNLMDGHTDKASFRANDQWTEELLMCKLHHRTPNFKKLI